jgi:hypothetical protein
MNIHTGHATFDRQCDGISTGNVYGNVQKSAYIRAYTETECNGKEDFQPGALREYDFRTTWKDLPSHIRSAVEKETMQETAILYEFRHWINVHGGRKKIVHGYILTRGQNKEHRLLRVFNTGDSYKSRMVLETCSKYISESPEDLFEKVVVTLVDHMMGEA